MSARAAVGASNRAELFSGRNEPIGSPQRSGRMDEFVGGSGRVEFSPDAKQREMKAAYGLDVAGADGKEEYEDPLQLEHILGYAGDFSKTILALPGDENVFVKSMGSLVSIENFSDPQAQRILRGHDMQVSALAVAPSGKYVASGQVGTKHFKGAAAPVFLWNVQTGLRLLVLRGLTVRVNILAFSTDERFLCGCGEDSLMYIWDLTTGEVVFGQRFPSSISVLQWIEHRMENRRMVYEICLGISSNMIKATLSYDPVRVQWMLKQQTFTMPPGGGIIRYFNCVDASFDGVFIFVGTTGGDVLIFRKDTCVFRACLPMCTNGVRGVVALPNNQLLCCGGDGSVQKLEGHDMSWQRLETSNVQEGGVTCVSLSANKSEVIIGTSAGAVVRMMIAGLEHFSVGVAHTSEITCIAFGTESSNLFATGTYQGEIRIWDIADYTCLALLRVEAKAGSVTCLAVAEDGSVISGWTDGFLRCHDATLNRQLWIVPGAHRGGVTTLALKSDSNSSLCFIATGGIDGTVRVWRLGNRELVTQYTEHTKPVSKVLIDVEKSNVLHSVGGDGTVLSFDLKAGRRIMSHICNGCTMLDMTQRRDSELELVTSDNFGRILHWDCDIRDAVLAIQDPTRTAIMKCSVSPSGKYMAFAGDDMVLKILEVSTGEVVSLGQGHSACISALSWTPDERQLVTGGHDCCLCIWNFYLGGHNSSTSGGEEKKDGNGNHEEKYSYEEKKE